MRIGNFLENRQILNYHCPDHRSKVFVEQQLFSTCFRHNGLGKHTLYPGTKKSKNLLHSAIGDSRRSAQATVGRGPKVPASFAALATEADRRLFKSTLNLSAPIQSMYSDTISGKESPTGTGFGPERTALLCLQKMTEILSPVYYTGS